MSTCLVKLKERTNKFSVTKLPPISDESKMNLSQLELLVAWEKYLLINQLMNTNTINQMIYSESWFYIDNSVFSQVINAISRNTCIQILSFDDLKWALNVFISSQSENIHESFTQMMKFSYNVSTIDKKTLRRALQEI